MLHQQLGPPLKTEPKQVGNLDLLTRPYKVQVEGDLVNAICGHVSQRMRDYCSHQRTEVGFTAAQAIQPIEQSIPARKARIDIG